MQCATESIQQAIREYPGMLNEGGELALRYFCSEVDVKTIDDLANPEKISARLIRAKFTDPDASLAIDTARFLLIEHNLPFAHFIY